MTELSKKSLVRQIIKNELKKYFDIEKSSKLGEKLIKKNLIELGFKNKSELSMFLESENLNYEIFKEKLIFENLWNSLVFEKFKNKVKIDESKIRARIIKLINNQEKIYEYNLSEILVDFDTNYIELQNYIEKFSFENAASKYSLSDTASNGGKIGWINPNILTKNLKEKITKLKVGEITDPIKVPNGNLLLKLNSKKEIKNKINVDNEVNKQINFERNRQLNSFSLNYYKKLKQNSIINEY